MNATKHGCRAETLVLPDEDKQGLEDRRAAWSANLGPRGDLEQRAVDEAVEYSWRQDRARRAEVKRAYARLDELSEEDPVSTAAGQEVVRDLGQQLFTDRLGPIMYYPFTGFMPLSNVRRDTSTSYPSIGNGKRPDEALSPDVIVLRLKSTLAGCEWMLAEWERLKTVLDDGRPWIVQDKLKAVRLLGRQPFDVLDDRDVALVYLASHRIKPHGPEWDWEILTEMNEEQKGRFRQNAADRELEALQPATAADARHVLHALVARQIEWLTARAESHRERECTKAARAADLLDFDDTPGGERLRRFEITSGRGFARSLDALFKLRKEDRRQKNEEQTCESEVIDRQLLEDAPPFDEMTSYTADAFEPEIDTSWALAIDTNELHGNPAVTCQSSAVRCAVSDDASAHENATTEANPVRENFTNEANGSRSPIDVSHCLEQGFAANAVNGAETNEANFGPLSVVRGQLSGDVSGLSDHVTNEANHCQSSTSVVRYRRPARTLPSRTRTRSNESGARGRNTLGI